MVIAHSRNLEERQYDIISPWESIAMATKNRFFSLFFYRVQYKSITKGEITFLTNPSSSLLVFSSFVFIFICTEIFVNMKNKCLWLLIFPSKEIKYGCVSFIDLV